MKLNELGMNKIILIRKYTPASCRFWNNLVRDKTIVQLTAEEIVNQYQGFEGEIIAVFSVNEDTLETINKYIVLNKEQNYCLLLVVNKNKDIPNFLKNHVVQVGFDYGILEEISCAYSSIFHEVLFGKIDELVMFKDKLNEHLLFPTQDLAKDYYHIHHKLFLEGKDVEHEEYMEIYEIWKLII